MAYKVGCKERRGGGNGGEGACTSGGGEGGLCTDLALVPVKACLSTRLDRQPFGVYG